MPAIDPSILVNRTRAAGILVVHGGELQRVFCVVWAIRGGVLDAFGLRELRRIIMDPVQEPVRIDFPKVGIRILG